MTSSLGPPVDRDLAQPPSEGPPVKVVVWDLDDTLWHGILSEGDELRLRDGMVALLEALDARGILCSIASRNDPADALERLERFGIAHFFVAPAVGWGRKVEGVRAIAAQLDLGLDSFLFVDDQEFELDEMRFELPEVRTLAAGRIDELLRMPALDAGSVTAESATRREFYQQELRRRADEAEFRGSSDEFLATLGMVLTIRRAQPADLERAAELTLRTNQLNATGRTYSEDRLRALLESPDHLVVVAELEDRYGRYGIVGLSVIERSAGVRTIMMILMSCRVIARGVTGLFLREIVVGGRQAGEAVRAEFVERSRNRAMKIAFGLAGFKPVARDGDILLFEHDGSPPPPVPIFITVDSRL